LNYNNNRPANGTIPFYFKGTLMSSKSSQQKQQIERAFTYIKIGMIAGMFTLFFLALSQFLEKPTMILLIATLVNVVAIVLFLFGFIDKLKHYYPKFYISSLILVLGVLIVELSTLNYIISTVFPDSFQGISTRIDAFYFTIGMITTAGTGEIQPVSQIAKFLVCGETILSFTIVVLFLVKEHLGLKSNGTAR
jgi:hypothetical protein